uniref:HotDog ACOT-type domain-containing protein n=1 Tax=Chrysotila carterae TaxID=13221 RepID=A0A7S4C2Y0_CHRCT
MALGMSFSKVCVQRGARGSARILPRVCRRSFCDALKPGKWKSPITSRLWADREKLAKQTEQGTESPSYLVTKTPADSATCILYAFGSDAALRERYRNPFGSARTGILLEDMDALAGNIAFKHSDDNNPSTRPLLLVTASVDQIKMEKPIVLEEDMELSGKVAWVGRSSMRIRMQFTQGGSKVMGAAFTFVARDRNTSKSTPINPLMPISEEEKRHYDECEQSSKLQKELRQRTPEQRLEAHTKRAKQQQQLLREANTLLTMPSLAPADTVLMTSTETQNALICQPQQRNTAGRIFGGFLMRRAFELAFSTCYLFAGSRPRFEQVEQVSFHAPVDVGSLLRLRARVVHTQPSLQPLPLVTIDVLAVVAHPETRASVISNTFTFSFSLSPDEMERTGNTTLKRVLPSDGESALRQIEAVDMLNGVRTAA